MGLIQPRLLASFALVLCLIASCDRRGGNVNRPPNSNQGDETFATPTATPPTNCTTDPTRIIYGITIEDTEEPDRIVNTISRIRRETGADVAVRVVIDPEHDLNAEGYGVKLAALKGAGATVMALLADSHDLHRFSSGSDFKPDDVSKYKNRVQKVLSKFGGSIDIWEIGNEVNGEWSGWKEKDEKDATQDWERVSAEKRKKNRQWVYNQVKAAYDVLQPAGKCMAVTFYYNDDGEGHHCWPKIEELEDGAKYEMLTWIDEHFTDKGMRDHIKYVFISYYENPECKKLLTGDDRVDAGKFATVLGKLSERFANADVGFGEFGPECDYPEGCHPPDKKKDDRSCERCDYDVKTFIPRYYRTYHDLIKGQVSKYVGGYFYWFGLQDMIPEDRTAVNELIKALSTH